MAAHREAYQAQQHQSDARLKGIHLFTGIDMSEGTLACLYHNCEIMSIPLSSISDVNMVSPTEIEVTIPYENYNEQDDVLCELRFYVPGRDGMLDHIKGKMEGGGNNVAEVLYQEMRRKAKLDDNAGDLIVRLPDLPLVVPRGKYTCDLYRNGVMRLHGNTFGYTVQFRNVVKSFLLPQNDEINTNLVLGFDKPLRQGSTIYPYIIFQFKTNFVHQVETKMPKSELETIHPDLQEIYDGPYYEIVARLFKMIININVIIPGDFVTLNGYKGLKCHVQNQEGTLYPLNKSLIFIRRPVIYIRLEDISRVEFARVSAGHGIRGFDFEVILKNGISSMFSNIDKRELDKVMGYFEKNRILTKTNENLDRANGDDIEYSDDEKKSYKGSDTRYEEDDDDFVAHDEEEGLQPSDAGTGSRARDEDDM